MTTLAEKAILSGAENHPPILEKDMHDSWKSRIELYMINRQHGRMILESVENGPHLWPTIEENGVTRPKKYSELSVTEAIQADCDVKETNIILQGLLPKVDALVSNHKFAKELWERIQLLMQGTSLTKQESLCKLDDEFDKFSYKKGESLREFYLRFSLLLNDMNIYIMKLEPFQVVLNRRRGNLSIKEQGTKIGTLREPSAPLGSISTTPSLAFIKESIEMQRTMIEEHDQLGNEDLGDDLFHHPLPLQRYTKENENEESEALASTIYLMIKFSTANGVATVIISRETLWECRQIEEAQKASQKGRITHHKD
nr:integrase, catalytic region, zinc finger, CCHC-type, peptidase aspartic, catalytic [Tanacetum cinerariifolium]